MHGQSSMLLNSKIHNTYPEKNIVVSRSFETGQVAPLSNLSEYKTNAVLACDIVFPTFPQTLSNVLIWETGGSGLGAYCGIRDGTTSTPKLRIRGGLGNISLPSASTNDLVVFETTDIPKDGHPHTLVVEFRITPGRIRVWIDGAYKGKSDTTAGGSLSASQLAWTGTNEGSYSNYKSTAICVGESTTAYYGVNSMKSTLRYYSNMLTTL